MTDNGFEEFLLNDEAQSGLFNSYTSSRMKVIKEIYDDRFDILYYRFTDGDKLESNNYNVGGYYDKVGKCVYEPDFYINKMINNNEKIKIGFFHNLLDKVINEITDSIAKYSFDNSSKLRKIGMIKFKNDDKWQLNSYEKEVKKEFVMNDECNIKLNTSYIKSLVDDIRRQYNGDFFIDYLKNPNELVKMCLDMITQNNKEKIGYELVVFDFKNHYLQKIIKNTNHEFNDTHISKKIFQSLKFDGFYPNYVNITIRYNQKDLTFKFDYNRLMCDIIGGNTSSSDYKNRYEIVSNFLKENSDKLTKTYRDEFDFSHIKSITYSRKELYRNDDIDKIDKLQRKKEQEL